MMNICTIAGVICGLIFTIEAKILTTYKRRSPGSSSALLKCGVNATGCDYCAVRVTNGVCEPLVTDWCEQEDMYTDGVYFVKQIVTEKFELSHTTGYRSLLPIYLRPDSALEVKFMLHSGWTSFDMNLLNMVGDYIYYIKLTPPNLILFYEKTFTGYCCRESFTTTVPYTAGVQYTLAIQLTNNGLKVCLDADIQACWSHTYTTQTSMARWIYLYTNDAFDLYQVTYRA